MNPTRAFSCLNRNIGTHTPRVATKSQYLHEVARAPVFRLAAFVVFAAFLGIAILLAIDVRRHERLEGITIYARDQADWAAYQLEADRFRLEVSLNHVQNGALEELPEAVQRYGIFSARFPILRQGDVRFLLRSMPAYSVVISKVGQFLGKFDPVVRDGLKQEEVAPMLKALAELRVPLTVLSNASVHARTLLELGAKEDVAFYDQTTFAIYTMLMLAIAGFAAHTLVVLRRALLLERLLRESRERLRDFARIAADWYWETDAEGRFVYISQPGRDTRFNPASLVGQGVLDLARRLPQNHSVASVLSGRVDQRSPFHELPLQAVALDGSTRHLSISGAPVFTSGAKFKGYRGNARDITEAIEADRALNSALAAARSASQAKSAFLANMSHELRTPLNAIIGFSEALRLFAGDRLNDKEVGYLSDIQTSGRHLLSLISSILELAKIEAGRLDLKRERVVIADIVGEAVRMLETNAKENGVVIDPDPSLLALPAISADCMRLRQVFINLISNAVKYTPEGGNVRIEGAIENSRRIRVSVIDEGIGMRPEDIPVALRPFERIGSQFTQNREGVGLGLPIAESLVRAHGGDLSIVTEIGRGTRVDLSLPIGGNDEGAAHAHLLLPEPSTTGGVAVRAD